MNIKKGDNIIIIAGKDRGKKGKVLKALPSQDQVVIEGANVKKKRQKPRKSNEKGQIIQIPFPIHISNVQLFCSACGKGSRVRLTEVKGKKVRTCVKCSKEF